MNDKYKSIFIHSLPRSSSTYFWNKFREQSKYRAYFEPFHEFLKLKYKTFDNQESLKKQNEYFKHNFMKDNPFYFEEYKNFYINSFIELFESDFTFKMSDLNSDDKNEKIFNYLNNIINKTILMDKIPVLKFIRSFLRLEWINKNFNTLNIFLIKDPRDIYQSFLDVAGKRLILNTLNNNNNKLLFLKNKFQNKLDEKNNFCKISNYDFYYIFYYIYKLYEKTINNISNDNDIIINVSKIENNNEYKNFIIEEFNKNNILIDLNDFKYNKYSSYSLSDKEFDITENEINKLMENNNQNV